jgi:predicted alpha/beta hydrolase
MTTTTASRTTDSMAVELRPADGVLLHGQVLAPQASGPLTVVSPATGVTARFYQRFGEYLASSGRPVLLFDYRGQGASAPKSLVGCPARFRDWGILDIPAAIDWSAANYDRRPLHWIGHSFGGFGAGLAHNNARIDRLFAFASMSADVRFMTPWVRVKTAVPFFAATLIARARGYLPGGLIGAEPLPRNVMLEWYRFCTTKGFLFGVDDLPEKRFFEGLRADVRLSFAEDDGWVSRAGTEHMLAHMPAAASRSIWQIAPEEARGQALGHVGFFRSEHRDALWPKALAWLDGQEATAV